MNERHHMWNRSLMNRRKRAAIVACSDPLSPKRLDEIHRLAGILQEAGVETELIRGFFDQPSISPSKKGMLLSDCFRDPEMQYIFDVSGGDLANQVLPWLDYDVIRNSQACFTWSSSFV